MVSINDAYELTKAEIKLKNDRLRTLRRHYQPILRKHGYRYLGYDYLDPILATREYIHPKKTRFWMLISLDGRVVLFRAYRGAPHMGMCSDILFNGHPSPRQFDTLLKEAK